MPSPQVLGHASAPVSLRLRPHRASVSSPTHAQSFGGLVAWGHAQAHASSALTFFLFFARSHWRPVSPAATSAAIHAQSLLPLPSSLIHPLSSSHALLSPYTHRDESTQAITKSGTSCSISGFCAATPTRAAQRTRSARAMITT